MNHKYWHPNQKKKAKTVQLTKKSKKTHKHKTNHQPRIIFMCDIPVVCVNTTSSQAPQPDLVHGRPVVPNL
jgi:UDP-N-acetyl-D-mannosaminuronate dehydrogenase